MLNLLLQQQQLLIQSNSKKKVCQEETIFNPWEAMLLAEILSTSITIVGIILEVQKDPMIACALVGALLIASFPIWGICIKYMISSEKDKVKTFIAAIVVALLTYIPATYFMFAASVVTKWGYTSHLTYMVVLGIMVIILGLSAVILPLYLIGRR